MRQFFSRMLRDRNSVLLSVLILLFAVTFLFVIFESTKFAIGMTSVNSSLANLTIWDQTDSVEKYTYPTCYETYGPSCLPKAPNLYNIYFYANFTNKTSGANITGPTANCTIRFNENQTGAFTSWYNMTYTPSTGRYQYNRSFRYKGEIPFEVNCSDVAYLTVNASENATISNTQASIFAKDPGGKLPPQSITEDTIFYYNFSMNCSDDDQNDIPNLIYSYVATNTTLTNFTLGQSNGTLRVNISTDSDVGSGIKRIDLTCSDGEGPTDVAIINSTITKVNDAPIFLNLNETMNATENIYFYLRVNASDEENNLPFYYNVSFDNCTKEPWTNTSNCTLFTINYVTGEISFTPTNDDIGVYTINFTVRDTNNVTTPYNNSRNFTVIFTVVNVNNPPVIDFLCNDKKNATEDTIFSCMVNATDTDEASNLTFISNTSWFTFNNSKVEFVANISGNLAEANISFTANDSAVGIWYINVSVNDSAGGIGSRVINFNVSNVNDSVSLGQINNSFETYAAAEFYLVINASDDDLRIPPHGKSCIEGCYNETITFTTNITGRNTTLFNIIVNTTEVIGNTTFAYIRFTPTNDDSGNYTINITVRDANNYSISSRTFNMSIYNNTAPYWLPPLETYFTFSEGSFVLSLSTNATDSENDTIIFSDNIDLFDITPSGDISISSANANDSMVGNHSATITITDLRGAVNSSQILYFTVKNVNETPVLYYIPTPQNATEDTWITINLSAVDEDLFLTKSYSASDFYPENIVWNINSTTSWFSATKLNFTRIDNGSASISFTPNKTDLGTHVINISINDSTGRMASQEFNLTVISINHPPYFTYTGSPMNLTLNSSNQYSCVECVDINASDIEDGEDVNSNSNLSFESNESWFSIAGATGKINFSVNRTDIRDYGWWINITVTDLGTGGSGNKSNSTLFRLMIYDYNVPPVVEKVTPQGLDTNTEENLSKFFMVLVTDANARPPNNDTLNITWKIDGRMNSTANITNGSSPSWFYYANFSDETTNTSAHNVSVWVYDSMNNFTTVSWSVSVNHTNAPVVFTGAINNITMQGTSYVNVTCNFGSSNGMCEYGGTSTIVGGYFSDVDHSDARYNVSINLTLGIMNSDCSTTINNSNISVIMNNNTLGVSFYSTISTAICFNITAFDSENSTFNKTSNKFIVNMTVTPPVVVNVPTPAGGGGAETKKKVPVALKIIVPDPFTMFTQDKIVVPIRIQNRGKFGLSKIHLYSFATFEGITTELEKNFFESLSPGAEEKFDLTIITNTNSTGSYEIIINATVENPVYSDTASFFVNLIEIGWKEKIKAQEKIIFLEELLIGNPECLELTEILNEAKKAFDESDYKKSLALADNAIQACKYAVTSKGRAIEIKRKFDFGSMVLMFTAFLLFLLFIIFIYQSYKRTRFKRGKD